MGFGAIMVKKRVSTPKRVYSKGDISGSQGRWTLGLCMEATKRVIPFINTSLGPTHKKTIFNTSALGAHKKLEKWPKCQHWDMYAQGTPKPI